VVAGAAALYLQRCPNASYSEVVSAIRGTARTDAFTGAEPNNRWGYGKLDGFAAVVNSTRAPITGPGGYCVGGAATVQGPLGMDSYTWSTGSTESAISVADQDPFSLVVTTPAGCTAWSDTVQLDEWALPAQPVVTVDNAVLSSTAAASYQWFFNGNPVVGATEQELEATASGNYFVLIGDANGCTATSAPMQVIVTGVEDLSADGFAVWPSPTSAELMVRSPASDAASVRISVLDASGREVLSRRASPGSVNVVGVQELAPGTYVLRMDDGSEVRSARFVKQQ